jgi:hypothetical protein
MTGSAFEKANEKNMHLISDMIIAHPEINSFSGLEELVKEAARHGAIHLNFDLKPEYPDTPRNWQDRLETAFLSIVGSGS